MKHILKKTGSLFFMLLLLSVRTLMAQQNHEESSHSHANHPPHGGQIKEVGKYQIEMVTDLYLKKDQLSFYLFTSNLVPISIDGISGTVTIEYKNGSTTTDTLLANGDDYFVAQLGNKEPFTCTIKLQEEEKVVIAVFSVSELDLKTNSVYTCSMHPEIVQNRPGKCPKCGMELIATKKEIKKEEENHGGHNH
jgi:hypothetical protein